MPSAEILSRHDVEQRFALLRRRALVDDRLQLTVALVQRAGKINGRRENQAVEFGVFEMPLGDPHADHALAIAFSRQGIEIARTAKCAVAVLDPFAFETPVGCSHGKPPRCVVDWTAAAWHCCRRQMRDRSIGAMAIGVVRRAVPAKQAYPVCASGDRRADGHNLVTICGHRSGNLTAFEQARFEPRQVRPPDRASTSPTRISITR